MGRGLLTIRRMNSTQRQIDLNTVGKFLERRRKGFSPYCFEVVKGVGTLSAASRGELKRTGTGSFSK